MCCSYPCSGSRCLVQHNNTEHKYVYMFNVCCARAFEGEQDRVEESRATVRNSIIWPGLGELEGWLWTVWNILQCKRRPEEIPNRVGVHSLERFLFWKGSCALHVQYRTRIVRLVFTIYVAVVLFIPKLITILDHIATVFYKKSPVNSWPDYLRITSDQKVLNGYFSNTACLPEIMCESCVSFNEWIKYIECVWLTFGWPHVSRRHKCE